jgi:hypothetical protein
MKYKKLLVFFIPDINELNLPKTCQVDFPDPDDLLNFKLVISPDEVGTSTVGIKIDKVQCKSNWSNKT